MRRTLVVPLMVVIALLGGCARDDGGPAVATAGGPAGGGASAAPTPSADEAEQRRQFTRCMRDNGVDIEDAEDGRIAVRAAEPGSGGKPGGKPGGKVEAAMEKCRSLLPNGGVPPELSPEDVEKMRAMARCMRANGVPGFPDPDPATGVLRFGEDGDADPEAMRRAAEACKHLGPDRVGDAPAVAPGGGK
ncbi:hypothetical protein [Spirilliplanes yamanashiensis]|uniref:Uncharacterized protein n=1 Tax=Spirilliplanes yamanashiensis TaxID=42233 RepID=A0A8J3Y4I6_9ACTN|nr:hypothetical protein [Spirilliplanes yamanashiensis]MDP9819567.1 hypothetical protein [Spirilliplanes yamanashiensis]GIJ01611.1 hypothetical protein Sya03_09630 [Spirilliplanes yamanashiensis]